MADETQHTVRFAIPKSDNETWEQYNTFVEMLAGKGYLRKDGFTHGSSTPTAPGLREALVTVRDRIASASREEISDTFWLTPTETVVDFIDGALNKHPNTAETKA